MSVPLRVLIVEDSEDDALLILQELRNGNYDPIHHRVEKADALHQALLSEPWELIITDHGLPQFDSAGTLHLVKNMGMDIPVIIVSGTIGEELAVEAMKAGAYDYVLKDNLVRLVPAIVRSLDEAETRRAHRRAEEAMHHMAYHDALTGLVNRLEFERRLEHALLSARERELQHALLYLDLDQFKLVNDTCGHNAGDEMLRQLAVLLRARVRNNDTLARLGGDEFGILLESCVLDHAQRIAENIRQAVQSFRFAWNNTPFTIGVSIGIVSITADSREIVDVLSAADIACYAAKDAGRNRIQIYHESNVELARRYGEMQWVTRINQALDQNKLILYQQPIFCLVTDADAPFGHEFLLRMLDEHERIILPGAFIPAAERYNLMPQLDRWVVQAVFSHMAGLPECHAGGDPVVSFINLSGASLSDKTFFDFIRLQMQIYGIKPGHVCFEITETAAIANLNDAVVFIKEIKEQGCYFALDDFGTGLSSFSYLKTLPVDFLKIDGSFVQNILLDPMDYTIVDAIHRIGFVAGIKTIAEQVETSEVQERLREIGIDYVQGYGIEKPQAIVLSHERMLKTQS